MFDVIERLKSEWTDKFVMIDSPAPELARFSNATGVVKTVNMNGRCLVEFDQFNNVGWYDIDPGCLKVVPKPLPKPAEAKPKPAVKPAAAKPAVSPAAEKPAVRPAAGKRPSTADILAAARGVKSAAPSVEPAAAAEPAEAPAVEAPPGPAIKAAKPAGKAGPLPTTTAEKIAWCRAHDAPG